MPLTGDVFRKKKEGEKKLIAWKFDAIVVRAIRASSSSFLLLLLLLLLCSMHKSRGEDGDERMEAREGKTGA